MSEPSLSEGEESPGAFEDAALFQIPEDEMPVSIRLSQSYQSTIKKFEVVIQDYTTEGSPSRLNDLEESLLLLRLWGTDVDAEDGSLDILESQYPKEALHVQSYLQKIMLALGVFDTQSNEVLIEARSSIKSLKEAIHDLVELVDPIRIYVDLHRQTGPISKLKNALENFTQRALDSRTQEEAGKWQQSMDPVPLDIRDSRPSSIQEDGAKGLDSTYQIRDAHFFKRGTVFSMLYTKPAAAGTVFTETDDAYSIVRFGELAYSIIRRFIAVYVQHDFVYACAITTYNNRGTSHPWCDPTEHSIVYFSGTNPSTCYLEGEVERGMIKDPIEIIPYDRNEQMSPASRIRFGKLFTIEMNIKVKYIGQVHPRHMEKLLAYYLEYVPRIS